jgi:hypothetical protein
MEISELVRKNDETYCLGFTPFRKCKSNAPVELTIRFSSIVMAPPKKGDTSSSDSMALIKFFAETSTGEPALIGETEIDVAETNDADPLMYCTSPLYFA